MPPAPPAPPETYELTLPAHGAVDASDLDTVVEMAKAKGWSNEQAQAALSDLNESLTAQKQAFRTELEQHPEIGGAHLTRATERAVRALDRFLPASSPEGAQLRAVMTKTGYGDYAPLVLLLSRIGNAMAEDRPNLGRSTPPASDRRPTEDVMFPSSAPRPT
jgi:hypothetical protein